MGLGFLDENSSAQVTTISQQNATEVPSTSSLGFEVSNTDNDVFVGGDSSAQV